MGPPKAQPCLRPVWCGQPRDCSLASFASVRILMHPFAHARICTWYGPHAVPCKRALGTVGPRAEPPHLPELVVPELQVLHRLLAAAALPAREVGQQVLPEVDRAQACGARRPSGSASRRAGGDGSANAKCARARTGQRENPRVDLPQPVRRQVQRLRVREPGARGRAPRMRMRSPVTRTRRSGGAPSAWPQSPRPPGSGGASWSGRAPRGRSAGPGLPRPPLPARPAPHVRRRALPPPHRPMPWQLWAAGAAEAPSGGRIGFIVEWRGGTSVDRGGRYS
jgi:hypothetical protein